LPERIARRDLPGGFFASAKGTEGALNPRIPRDSSDAGSCRTGSEIVKIGQTQPLIKISTHFRGLIKSTRFISKM
jgi:hypothetical protein